VNYPDIRTRTLIDVTCPNCGALTKALETDDRSRGELRIYTYCCKLRQVVGPARTA
jgi:hypothetical protein